jgi:glycosyltransferase involved in cell wall biosynthesis
MKILIVMDTLGAGGSEKSMALVADHLHAQGVDFAFVCLNRVDVGVEEEILSKGYKVFWLEGNHFLSQVFFIHRLIRKEGYKLVHSVLLRSNLRVRMCRLFSSFIHVESLVNTSYSPDRFRDPKANKLGIVFYYLLDLVTSHIGTDHFHSVNEAVKRHYMRYLRLPSKRITVVYRGREEPTPDQVLNRSSLGWDANDFIIINTGRHEFQKDQLSLLKGIHLAREQGMDRIKLVILGREGSCTPLLKEYIAANGLEQHVQLAGYRTDVSSVLPLGNLFALSSLFEGTAGALIEAQAAGLPIICNALEELQEIVLEGANTLFFRNRDVASIADAIRFFYESPERCTAFSKASRNHYAAKFTLQQSNEAMFRFYQDLLKSAS